MKKDQNGIKLIKFLASGKSVVGCGKNELIEKDKPRDFKRNSKYYIFTDFSKLFCDLKF